ncbi:MAG: AI-2E family transporter [Alphaproteobacteria bacterium]|nr:AI-2E family transporter [Alphaproteobacteria bacterium]
MQVNEFEDGDRRTPPPVIRTGGAGRVFYFVATAGLLFYFGHVARGILIPAIVAGFACFLIFTLKELVRKTPLVGKHLPNFFAYIFAFGLIVSATILFIEIVRDNVNEFIEAWPQYEKALKEISETGITWLRGNGLIADDFVGGVEQVRASALSLIQPVLREIGAVAQSLASNSITVLLYTVFMLLERGRIFRKIALLSHDDGRREAVNETISDIAAMVRQYITVKTLTNLTTAAASFGVLKLIGVQFAGFWALLIFLLNYIPIVGAIAANALPVVLALVQPEGGGLQKAAMTLVSLVALEQTMSSVIEPRLIGRSLNLSPLVILLSLGVWGALWGFAGALLAVPMTVTVMIILTQLPATRPIAILMSENGNIAPIRHGRPAASAEDGSETG